MWRRIWKAALMGALLAVPAQAQDTATQPADDLKDFRLDTPPPSPAESATPAPVVTAAPPAAVEQPKKKVAKPTPRQLAPKPAPKAVSATPAISPSPTQADEQTTPPVANSAPAVTPAPSVSVAPENRQNTSAAQSFNLLQLWPLGAALLAALAAFIMFRLWKNRLKNQVDAQLVDSNESAQSIIPQAVPPPVSPPIKPSLTARFEPDDARLSLANLTIKGRLHLRYDGAATLETLKLRTGLLSACNGQKSLIDAFHNDPQAGEVESLGPVVPGEQIDLTLEMQVPRDSLQAFDWRERQFVAPIVVINISSEDPAQPPCRVTCVVGQKGDPDSPRLLPIPIDRGPKKFEALEFRPIAA